MEEEEATAVVAAIIAEEEASIEEEDACIDEEEACMDDDEACIDVDEACIFEDEACMDDDEACMVDDEACRAEDDSVADEPSIRVSCLALRLLASTSWKRVVRRKKGDIVPVKTTPWLTWTVSAPGWWPSGGPQKWPGEVKVRIVGFKNSAPFAGMSSPPQQASRCGPRGGGSGSWWAPRGCAHTGAAWGRGRLVSLPGLYHKPGTLSSTVHNPAPSSTIYTPCLIVTLLLVPAFHNPPYYTPCT